LKLYPVGLKADVISRIRPALVVLAAAGLVLVLMLMVNLSSVLLARAAQREHEVAVSRALGANTIAIVRSILLEGSLLGLGGGAQGRWRRGMIVAQVALSLVLLSCGALVMRSFERLLRADPGFRPDGVFTVRLRTPPEFFPKASDTIAFQDRVQNALAAIPGVTGASAASALPLTATVVQATITIPGAPGNTGDGERDKVLTDM